LNGHEYGIAGGERVDSEKVERWGAVYKNIVVLGENSRDDCFELVFTILDWNELNCRSDQIFVGWDEIEPLDLGVEKDALNGLVQD
jgi:hypothetical protein